MKKLILILALSLTTGYFAAAQAPVKPKHMMISIIENPNSLTIGHTPNLFITRDDTAQVKQYVDFNLHVKLRDATAAHEAQLMQILKPYYDSGWKLISTSVVAVPYVNNYVVQTSRYIFTKED